MIRLFSVLFILTSFISNGQIEVVKLNQDTSIIWKQDRYFIHEYLIRQLDVEKVKIDLKDMGYSDTISIMYSINNKFIGNEFILPNGISFLRIWIRADKNFITHAYPFELTSSEWSYKDTVKMKLERLDSDRIHVPRVSNWIDFYSSRKEEIQLQLFDELWHLKSTFNSNSDRIDVSELEMGKYFLKMEDQIVMIQKINPEEEFVIIQHSTTDHSTIQLEDKSK